MPAHRAHTRVSTRTHSRPPGAGVLASVLGLTAVVGCGSATAAAPPAADGGPFPYQLAVARDRNVVVVVESTGWTERTEVALELALQRAIPGEQGRCGENVLPCPHPYSSAGPGSFDVATDPLLTDADWARIARVENHPVTSGAPTDEPLGCVAVVPGRYAMEVHAAAYVAPTHPGAGLEQFVIRYPDDGAAATAVADLRDQFLACPDRTARGEVAVQLHEHRASDEDAWWTVDEAFVGDRTLPGRGQITGG